MTTKEVIKKIDTLPMRKSGFPYSTKCSRQAPVADVKRARNKKEKINAIKE